LLAFHCKAVITSVAQKKLTKILAASFNVYRPFKTTQKILMYEFSKAAPDTMKNDIVVQGVPFDRNSSFRRGPALAPDHIRNALFSDSSNMWTENGIDLGQNSQWHLLPNLGFSDQGYEFEDIENQTIIHLNDELRVVTLGGDHSITYPLIRAYAKKYNKLNVIHFDAHPDLYDELDGNRHSHACPFARIMEEFPTIRLVQVGIRTATGHQRQQAARFGVEMIEMRDLTRMQHLVFDGPVYLSLDLDCLDPAFAPGVSHYEPGGMSTREVLNGIQTLSGELVGADIVEYNPEYDPQGITGMVAAKLLKEILGKMLAR
jgi:agmatinase